MNKTNNKSMLITLIILLGISIALYAFRGTFFGKMTAGPVVNEGVSGSTETINDAKITLSDLPTVLDRSTVGLIVGSEERSTGLSVEVVNTDASRAQGLSGRDGLIEGKGMLFAFPASSVQSFWMKDMKFALDIIWIDSLGKIVHIDKNISPDTYPKPFPSPVEVQFVLEVSAGFSDFFEVKVGDKVSVK